MLNPRLSGATPVASNGATTLHIDAANNVTVRALVYRAQTPESPQGDDGEFRTRNKLVRLALLNDDEKVYRMGSL